MNNLPPFTIENIQFNNMLEESGDDLIDIYLDIVINEEYHWYFVPFHNLCKHAAKYFPQQSVYIESVGNSIVGFGPKHTEWVNILQEEGFDFIPLLHHFVETYTTLDYLEKRQNITEQQHKELENKLDHMGDLLHAGKELKLKYVLFADTLMDYANKLALETYPEILNSKPEYIKELQNVLIRHVQNLSEALNELAEKAMDNK